MTKRSTLWTIAAGGLALAMAIGRADAQRYGPIDVDLPAGGDSYIRAIGGDAAAPVLAGPWTLSSWVEAPQRQRGVVLIGGLGDGALLPAYFSGNYVSLLPGETRTVEIRHPRRLGTAVPVAIRGWNLAGGTVHE